MANAKENQEFTISALGILKRYHHRPYAEFQKAKLMFVTLGSASIASLLAFLIDINDGHGSILEAALYNLSLLPILLLGMVLIQRGFYQKSAPFIIVSSVVILCLSSIWMGIGDSPESFYRTASQFYGIPVLVSALLTGKRTVLTTMLLTIGWTIVYWFLFCANLPEAVRDNSLVDMGFSTVVLFTIASVTLALVILFDRALLHTQNHLELNQKLNSELEMRVRERTIELEEARNAAVAATQAKSDFLANMSHEIRTPLSGILGMTQLLARKELDAEDKENMQIILDSGAHLLSVIQDVLDYSKIEAGKLEVNYAAASLHGMLQSIQDLLLLKAQEKNLYLHIHKSDQLPVFVLADELRIKQILLNLVGNAIKFTQFGGVTIETDLSSRQGNVCHILFRITDTGIGISEENMAKIMQRYIQADTWTTQKFGGTGLGLAITRSLLELMGSELQIHSLEGEGTIIEFTLHLGEYNQSPPAEKMNFSIIPTRLGENLRVLVAEDNALNQKLVSRLLTQMQFEVECVNNGLDALNALSSSSFDLVLMDCQMPVLDGISATRKLREWLHTGNDQERQAANTKIIGLSADAQRGARERCLEAGMNDYMIKPFQMDHFVKTIERWI